MIGSIFEQARVFDGTGSAPFTADVGVVGDRIALIGDLRDRDARERIDARGLALAPGFIDAQTHADALWLADPRREAKIRQGVTTEIGGGCGRSVAPIVERAPRATTAPPSGRTTGDDGAEWRSFDEFFGLVEASGVALNVAALVGLSTTRAAARDDGGADRPLERAELDAQARLVRAAIEEGAIGVSCDLERGAPRDADLDEVVAMARVAAEAGAPRCVTHLRSESDGLVAAVDEALTIGRRAEVAVQIAHHKAARRRNWGRMHASLERIDRARADGVAAHIDVYPYVASWIELAALLPPELRHRGADATLEQLRNPALAALLAARLELAHAGEWSALIIAGVGSERNADLVGERLGAVARRLRLAPARAAIRLLCEERLAVDAFWFCISEDDVATALSAGFTCIGSDAPALASIGAASRPRAAHGIPHPRAFGTFPRVFGRFVRGRRTLALEEAVRRMTSLPAEIYGLRDRGRIAPGAHADLVLFDPERVVDAATYAEPRSFPHGIRRVDVNGVTVVRDGGPIGALPGRVLRGGA